MPARLRDKPLDIVLDHEARGCSDEELPATATVVRFRRTVDPRAVLAILEPEHHHHTT